MARRDTLLLALPLAMSAAQALGCGAAEAERYEPRTFLGYACEGDCQRHKSGFRWAEQQALTDAAPCVVLPRLEAQGCAAFVDQAGDAAAAGERWAVENEIAFQCECGGGGARFFAGCVRQLSQPINTY